MKSNWLVDTKLLVRRIFLMMVVMAYGVSYAHEMTDAYPVPENAAKTHFMLGIIGYNYTDQFIDGFSVAGHSGGDIRLSSPTTGGSGTVCCFLLSKQTKWPMQVRVRWQSGGCRVRYKNPKFGHNQNYYKEAMVPVERGTSEHPSDIGVHFYKDGTVRIKLSDGWEPPLLKLQEDRSKEVDFPDCKQGDEVQYP